MYITKVVTITLYFQHSVSVFQEFLSWSFVFVTFLKKKLDFTTVNHVIYSFSSYYVQGTILALWLKAFLIVYVDDKNYSLTAQLYVLVFKIAKHKQWCFYQMYKYFGKIASCWRKEEPCFLFSCYIFAMHKQFLLPRTSLWIFLFFSGDSFYTFVFYYTVVPVSATALEVEDW